MDTGGKSKALAHELERADIKAGHAAAEWHDQPAVRALKTVRGLADQPPLIALSVATAAVGALRGDRRLARTGARMLASHLAATAIKAFIKSKVDRARPKLFSSEHDHRLTRGDRNEGPHNSFPSGHTAGAMAVSRAIMREYPGARVPAYLGAALAGGVQLPTGSHFPIDIAAGALIGAGAEAVVARVFPDPAPDSDAG
jgi:membrane-associated phospholipid phosphatase